MKKDKKILILTSRSFFNDYRVLKSIYNLYNFSKNISVAQILKNNEVVESNKTIFNFKLYSIGPRLKGDLKKKKFIDKLIYKFKNNKFFK